MEYCVTIKNYETFIDYKEYSWYAIELKTTQI